MAADGQPELAIRAFLHAYETLARGDRPTIPESSIEPAKDLPRLEDLPETPHDEGHDLLAKTIIIKLNGGLGTGMGLEKAKSLLEVRPGQTFLDLIARQILHLRQSFDSPLRFLLMSSFSTAEDTANHLAQYPALGKIEDLQFIQSRVPKVDKESLLPATSPARPELEWCPPGHGDLYPMLAATGWLDRLLADGVRYAFVSNSDNLGATLDMNLLGYFSRGNQSFLMEVTRRTEADKKGGHLAVDRESGQLLLRESAQCAEEDAQAFQEIERHRYFNTNNLWLRLDALKEALDEHGGFLPLAVITNEKTLDPRDTRSAKVIQLESAMGAAISCLPRTGAVVVPRGRFAPVKSTEDLLALRSDAYDVTPDYRLELLPSRQSRPPSIQLDSKHYKMVDQLEAMIAQGVPSLKDCERLEIQGPVRFAPSVELRGQVKISNRAHEIREVPSGAYTDKAIDL